MSNRIAQGDPDTAAAAVGGPLVQETGRVDSPVRNTEIACIHGVEQLDPKLEDLAASDPSILRDGKIDHLDAVGAQ